MTSRALMLDKVWEQHLLEGHPGCIQEFVSNDIMSIDA